MAYTIYTDIGTIIDRSLSTAMVQQTKFIMGWLKPIFNKVPRRFKWNSSKNLCQYSAKYWHEEKTWTATRYCYWDWGFSLPGN